MSEPGGVVVVALPAAGDPVHALADAEPHVTLLYLGEAAPLPEDALEAALANAEMLAAGLGPFPVAVNGAAVLGEDRARVLLVESEELTRVRELLLTVPAVATAVAAAEQFPNWIPHMTLTYAEDADLDEEAAELAHVRIGALAVWAAAERWVFPLTGPSRAEARPEWDDPAHAVTASAVSFSCPAVTDARSLAVAVRWADRHPAARVFVVKHAARLGLVASLPGWPEVAETVVNVSRTTARITASGALVNVATGAPVSPPPPPRRLRRQGAVARPVADPADLLAEIRKAPADPARRRALIEIAQRLDRLRFIPADWPERPVQPHPRKPGAVREIYEAAYPWTRAKPKPYEASRQRLARLEPVLDAPTRDPRASNGGCTA